MNNKPYPIALQPSLALSADTHAWNARFDHPVPHTEAYYLKCMFAGVLACGVTHFAITPMDVAKCNIQTNPSQYKSLAQSCRLIAAQHGSQALWKGWAPTLLGYSMQGFCKYGLYEIFKDAYSNAAGEEVAYKYRDWIYLSASASAEVFADLALCPMEMLKVKMQTNAAYPYGLVSAVKAIRADPTARFPFGSLVPLWSRQIPLTMAKFYFFEKVVELFYSHVFTEDRSTYSKMTQLGVSFASGYLAGILCAIVSHPADTVVSRMSQPNAGSITTILRELGPKGVWRGLQARIIIVGTLTGFQWWIYDTFKTVAGLGTSGTAAKSKQ